MDKNRQAEFLKLLDRRRAAERNEESWSRRVDARAVAFADASVRHLDTSALLASYVAADEQHLVACTELDAAEEAIRVFKKEHPDC